MSQSDWPQDHMSVSSMTGYSRCPYQWYLIHVKNLRRPPGIAAHVGTGLHCGARMALLAKHRTGIDVSADEVIDASVSGFEERLREDDVMLSAEENASKSIVIGKAVDQVVAVAQAWARDAQPDYMPAAEDAVEKRWMIPIRSLGTTLVGVTDLEDSQNRIVDWKTGTRNRGGEERYSLQLTAYAMAYRYEHGEDPAEVRLDWMKTTQTPVRKVLSSQRANSDYRAILARLAAIIKSIRAGQFPPCNPGEWWCSSRWCGFWPCKHCTNR